jgi:tetratricopeptide (TPR) repeat protein
VRSIVTSRALVILAQCLLAQFSLGQVEPVANPVVDQQVNSGAANRTQTAGDGALSDTAESSAQIAQRSRILYIDVPVPFRPGQDPEMPPPIVPALPEEDAAFQRRAQEMQDYSAGIARTELQGGAWDQSLVEQLSALGGLQQQQGDHQTAIETLSRAMHVNRINAGLHTLDQVPVVEQMIDSYMALGDWENVDLYQNYLYFVQHKAFGGNDPRLIPVLHDLGQWNIEAFGIGFGEPLGVRLSRAQLLFGTAASMVGIHFGRNDERYVSYLRSLANSAYLVALHPDYMREIGRPEYRSQQDILWRQLNAPGRREPRGFQVGLDALQEIVDYYRDLGESRYALAEALVNLADWHLMFDRYRTAEEHYAQAWAILEESENSAELLAQLFGQVVPIPTFASLPNNLLIGSTASQERVALQQDYADVRLDLTDDGAPRNVEVISPETEANSQQLSRLRREVRLSVFRPQIVDGEMVASEGHLFRYRYWY